MNLRRLNNLRGFYIQYEKKKQRLTFLIVFLMQYLIAQDLLSSQINLLKEILKTTPTQNIQVVNIPETKDYSEPPKNIYMYWHKLDLPPKMSENVDLIKKLNPEFNIFIFDEEEARNFISKYFTSDILYAFDAFIPQAFKADIWRYCILYKYGGLYQDIKLQPINGFKYISLLNRNIFVRDIEPSGGGIYNAFIVSAPGNPVFKKALNQIVRNARNKFYGENSLAPTGPILLKKYFSNDELKNMEAVLHLAQGEHFPFVVKLNNLDILRMYKEYRDEQSKDGSRHHTYLWLDRKIYNLSINRKKYKINQ
jgi:mannosyltransferase OCH1-like enzyme